MTTQQTINLRPLKGLLIANQSRQIKKIGDAKFKVKSQTSKNSYIVSFASKNWICECPDHSYRHIKCKHICAMEIYIEQKETQTTPKPKTPTPTAGLW